MKSRSLTSSRKITLLAAMLIALLILPATESYAQTGNRKAKAADSDRDGVPDMEDSCPFAKGKKSANGCPEEKQVQSGRPKALSAERDTDVKPALKKLLAAAKKDFTSARDEQTKKPDGSATAWEGLISLPGTAKKPKVLVNEKRAWYVLPVLENCTPAEAKAKVDALLEPVKSVMGPGATVHQNDPSYLGTYTISVKSKSGAGPYIDIYYGTDCVNLFIER
jgi:hypothetical protein